jgi:hypothetical protein
MGQPSTTYKPGKLNYVWNYLGKTLKEFAEKINPFITVPPVIDADNNLIVANSATYTVDIVNGGTHSINNFSGMLIVNDHYDGRVETWIAGGGDTVLLGATNLGGDPCGSTLIINGSGYDWTNVDNLTGPFTFTVITTRNEA